MPAQTLRVQALFSKKGGNTTTKKPSTVKKAAPAPKPKSGGTRKTKGWFGDEGGAQNLDKWYGTSTISFSGMRQIALAPRLSDARIAVSMAACAVAAITSIHFDTSPGVIL